MTVDDAVKGLVAILVGAVGWLVRAVLGNREARKVSEQRLATLEERVRGVEDEALTQECVREVIDAALDRRDLQAAQRREEWDRRLTLQLERAVLEGVKECQRETQTELARVVPVIVKEVLQRTGRHGKDRT